MGQWVFYLTLRESVRQVAPDPQELDYVLEVHGEGAVLVLLGPPVLVVVHHPLEHRPLVRLLLLHEQAPHHRHVPVDRVGLGQGRAGIQSCPSNQWTTGY